MRVLVCTVVHHPADARILHRQIRALLDAGHDVTYIAPFRHCRVTPWPGLEVADVPRATGRRRFRALFATRRAIAHHAPHADLLVIHDPELLLALPALRRPPTVWDVHEDTAAAIAGKAWIRWPMRRPLAAAVRAAERIAERRIHLTLAEYDYQQRFSRPHPVVPNTTYVPLRPPEPPGHDRVVYLGQLSAARGAADMVELARLLRPHGVAVELIGDADPPVRAQLGAAQAAGLVRWFGFVPNSQALRMVDGALAGLSLLHDEPNYRHCLPTKVVEYMARGVPVVTSPTGPATDLVTHHGCGFVVPFREPALAADAVLRLRNDSRLRADMGQRGHRAALETLDWPVFARTFVAQLEEWADSGAPVGAALPCCPPVRLSGTGVTGKR
jgi:glycosyltransferase involved in cell wall biosynthesis